MHPYLHILADGGTLSREEAAEAMHLMLRGEAEPEEVAGLLMGLRARGETIDELVGFTRVMREYAVSVRCDDPHAIDLCGTGGDSSGTFNISTTAAIVCAGAGVTVAKHGNRSVSSTCGSADVLEALGVNIELRREGVERCLDQVGLAFLFAPFFHPAMRFVMPVRKTLAVRTFFNVLGPLCNPAGVRRQLVGAFNIEVAQRMASILAHLDAEHVLTVHAEDGLDEITITGETVGFEFDAKEHSGPPPHPVGIDIDPEDHGIGRSTMEQLQGGSLERNVSILRQVLAGQRGPHRDIVVLNAAYALLTSGRFDSLEACFDAADESIDSGAAHDKLDHLIAVSNQRSFAA
ncbi:MAG: anthranilate phosphoribosyltransferase [Bacteroidetes bacterium]|jgi:anthranilate phosphoribosyltransferase|nr:anthranilate phosphoribosyltransferase [Bacteroidota bacterium]